MIDDKSNIDLDQSLVFLEGGCYEERKRKNSVDENDYKMKQML